MAENITDYVSVHERAAYFGCAVPQTIAVLPANFDTAKVRADFRQRSEAATVRTLFRNHKIEMGELLPASELGPYVQNNNFEWLAPILFVPAAMITENPMAVSLALSVLGNYITDLFKGMNGAKTVKLDIVVEKKGDRSCKMLRYEGGTAGLSSLPDIIRRISDE
jgi:hypothetical protein